MVTFREKELYATDFIYRILSFSYEKRLYSCISGFVRADSINKANDFPHNKVDEYFMIETEISFLHTS